MIEPWSGIDQIREMAAEINLGVRSISSLNIEQRRVLIEIGARVKTPIIYDGNRGASNVTPFRKVSESYLRMLDTLASQIVWKERDGYLRFCQKIIKAPRPRNNREVATLRLAVDSLINQQTKPFPETMVDFQC